ncbi:MAG: hypothetical protein M3Q23_13330 [Actinomycetota bacterium]|nr:hypothetical protein [Actinomycetota bacterium]
MRAGAENKMRVRVAERTQVNHEGKVYRAGEVVELPEEAARRLLEAGDVVEAPATKTKQPARARGKT